MRDAGETGQEEQHVIAGVLPHRDGDDGAKCQGWIPKPVGLPDAQFGQVVVEKSGVGQEDEDEQRRRSAIAVRSRLDRRVVSFRPMANSSASAILGAMVPTA